jgi:hypothetical protein
VKPHIPEAALKKHIAILGMNGSGKTSVAKSEVIEPALEAGGRVCNVDPTGVGWGLRLSKTGKSKGYDIYIVGGEHADFPLVPRDGKAWGGIVGTSSDSFVFDTSAMTVEGRSQWFTDFAETLLRKNKGPLNFVLDEAHLFAPQGGSKSGGVAPKMLHATNNLLALGRSKGLRITMISQRPAKLHKDSLTQAHTLIAMQLMSPQDRDAIKAWVSDQADAERGKEIIASLPNLDPGEGWIWAPKEKVLDRVRFGLPKTFDSSSAPDEADGEGPKLTPINPDAIKAKLETVAKETVANDPAKLRAEIAALRKELATKSQITQFAAPDAKTIAAAEQRGYARGESETAPVWLRRGAEAVAEAFIAQAKQFSLAPFILSELKTWESMGALRSGSPPERTPTPRPRPEGRSVSKPMPAASGNGTLPKGERLCLNAIAQNRNGVTRQQLTVITGYKRSTRDAYLQRLREKDYITDNGGRIHPTDIGLEALGPFDLLPTGEALQEHVLSTLPEGERAVLAHVISAYPQHVERDAISDATGYKRSTRDAYIQRLSTRELVDAARGSVRASEDLFE